MENGRKGLFLAHEAVLVFLHLSLYRCRYAVLVGGIKHHHNYGIWIYWMATSLSEQKDRRHTHTNTHKNSILV